MLPLTKDERLEFLQKKITELRVALFKAEINTELQLPNNIVSTIKADNKGNIWFFSSCNGNYAKNIDKSFYAYLEYYQKGRDCRLRLSGTASIVEDDNEPYFTSIKGNNNIPAILVMIQFKILHAEYFEKKQTSTFKEKIKSLFTDLFISHSYKLFDFS